MDVAVIGAGVGGLATAVGLARHGHEVTVHERRSDPGALGAGLGLFGNAMAALDSLGLGPAARTASTDVAQHRAGIRRPDGRWLLTASAASGATLRSIHRADLHAELLDALSDAAGPDALRVGSTAHVAPDGRSCITTGGVTIEPDLVVAADGLRSPARARLGLDPGLTYAGYTVWRGITGPGLDVAGEAGEAWGRGQRFGVVPLSAGRVYWFATQTAPEGADLGSSYDAVVTRFGGWHRVVGECLAATEPAAVLRHDIHVLARPLPTFVHGRTALLGDAAHPMTPDLGQGASQALEDAATLVALVGDGDARHVPAALTRYDELRRRRTQTIARQARTLGRVGQLSHPVLAGLRDAALRLAPAGLLAGRATQVQRWAPPTP